MNVKSILGLVKQTFTEWSEDNAARLAAALSYYTIFSLPPLLVILIALAGLAGRSSAAQRRIVTQVQAVIGEQGKTFVQNMLQNAAFNQSASLIATALGVIVLLFGALGIFGELQNALNTIWDVKPKPAQGLQETIRRLVIDRLLAFAMILVIGFLLLVSLLLSTGLSLLHKYVGPALPFSPVLLQILNLGISFGIITLLFAMIFKFLPEVKTAWSDVWLGAAVTSLLFSLGQFLLGFYLGSSRVSTTFGAAGSLAILLIWIYYSAQILLLGAEFTKVYASQFGSRFRPKEDVFLVREDSRPHKRIPYPEFIEMRTRTRKVQSRSRKREEKSLGGRILYMLLLLLEFIPSIRKLSASRSDREGSPPPGAQQTGLSPE